MSGVAGGNRIQKADVQRTFDKYVKQILEKIPGFKKASLSGSVKVGAKADYGDLDLVTWFEGDDKREVKQRIIKLANSQPDSIIVPFKSEKYAGKKYYNSGEIITVLFPIVGKQDEYIQVDNIISLTEEEHGFKNNFLDLPAEKQGLVLGLAKVITLEEDPQNIFRRLSISDIPPLGENEEFEFNISSGKLSLRKVKLDNFREVAREEIWTTTNWGLIKQLFKNYNIEGTFEDLLKDIKTKLKNPRSRNRVKGIFNSMVSVKSGEVGTEKAKGKEYALNAVNTLLEEKSLDYADILSQTEKEALEIVHKNWDVFDGKECNKGFCDIFAYKLQKRLPGSEIMHTEESEGPNETFGHVWLKYKGKYYDAETPQGVDHWKELPWMREFKAMNNKFPSDVEQLGEASTVKEIVSLYGGGFKPPHKAHFNNAKFLADKSDKLVIFIGPKVREGIRISAEQSKAIWEIYKKYLKVPVELVISKVTPIRDIYEFADNNAELYSKIITGALPEEMSRFAYFKKNKENYPNIEIQELPRMGDEENKFSATSIRNSMNYLRRGEWVPKELSAEDKKRVVGLAIQNSPSEKEIQMQETLDNTLAEIFKTEQDKVYNLNTPKFNQPKTTQQHLIESINEINLSRDNAVKIDGDLTGGRFKVGTVTYEYNIKHIKNPYKELGSFYNIQFTPEGEVTSIPKGGKENYIKILSTMYKIIVDFVEEEKPEYIGISSLDNSGDKNYHTVYNRLTSNTSNLIPNYFRKDTSLPFDSPQGSGKFIVLKRKSAVERKTEGSSGTAIAPQGAIRSDDRAKLVNVYGRIKNTIGDTFYSIQFNGDHIIVKNKEEGKQNSFDYTPYMASILEYMIDEGMKILPLPEIKIKRDIVESSNFFGRTAYYDPNNKEVVLYVEGRHPKDVMRSFTHEMIHHKQNVEGRLGNIATTNTNEDNHLMEIEKEAYLEGNITFRNWEDIQKNVGS